MRNTSSAFSSNSERNTKEGRKKNFVQRYTVVFINLDALIFENRNF